MRADRLVAALLLMQARGRVTAAELAGELEVSVATARRDLEALSAAGIPVYPQRGRGGGWSLVGGARTDLSGLSATEAQALFLLVGPAAAVSGEAKAALRKLVQALPRTFQADAEAAASAVMIDSTRWGERDRHRPEMVDLLQAAVVGRRKVRLTYTARRTRERSVRLVDPWGLVDKDDIWYLVAGTERGQRTFRVDRIVAAEPTDQPAERPDDFTLTTAWEQVVGEVEQQRSRSWATVLVETRFLPVLQDHFGRHCHTEAELADGRSRVRLAAPTPLDIARNLAGWGTMVEVVEPPGVQAQLARIGVELARRYADGQPWHDQAPVPPTEGEPMDSLEDARKRLDDEFGQVRRKLDKIHKALEKVEAAGPEDDLHGLLADLEATVKEVRDGGVVGSGANGHRRALKRYLEIKDG